MADASSVQDMVLTPADIPGADLSQPFDSHTMPALRWLLCRGISAPSSWKKKKLIDRFAYMYFNIPGIASTSEQYIMFLKCRMHEAINAGAAVVDVDGSYLYKKHRTLTEAGHTLAPLSPPAPPPSGWVTITEENHLQVSLDLPTGQYT